MKPLRKLAALGVVGAATFGGTLFADLFGVPESTASGQSLMARAPSMLPAPTGHAASAPGYYSQPAYNYNPVPYNANAAPAYAPASNYLPQVATSPYGYAAFPTNAYGSTYGQPAPYQVPYQTPNVQPSWPYVQVNDGQANDGQASVMRGRSEFIGGPPLSSPQTQLPAPSQQTPHNHMPMQQMPNYGGPSYSAPNFPMQMQPMPGYAMPGYPNGGASCDPWSSGYPSTYVQPAVTNWFGSFGAIVMGRDRADHYTFSYGTGNEADQRTDTRDADMNWTGGFDIRFGHYFNCQRNAIEAVYWNLNPSSQTTQTVSANVLGNLNGILNWNSLNYGGNPADIYVNVAPGNNGIHQLTRDYSFQNIELNLWQFCGTCGAGTCGCSRLRHNWLVGVRYFRFNESLLFAADANDTQITYANDEIFYNINIQNHLLGFQVGNQAQYCVTDRLTADLGIKLGLYSNQINHTSEIGGGLGVATINNGPFLGEEFCVKSSKNDIAFLGEVNLGMRYCFTYRWAGTIGYRALAVTGVAMPADQIYPDLRGINDIANIDSSRGMILHGGYAGLEYNW
jgi:hypothetical protein